MRSWCSCPSKYGSSCGACMMQLGAFDTGAIIINFRKLIGWAFQLGLWTYNRSPGIIFIRIRLSKIIGIVRYCCRSQSSLAERVGEWLGLSLWCTVVLGRDAKCYMNHFRANIIMNWVPIHVDYSTTCVYGLDYHVQVIIFIGNVIAREGFLLCR